MEAGLHLFMHYGSIDLSRISPLFRFQYFAGKNLSLVMGTLYGGHNHGLYEPLYRFERFMEDPPETGLQLLYQSERIRSDLYLNWRHYITRDAISDKEKFSVGWTNRLGLSRPGSKFQLFIPVQGVLNHAGSQTDTLSEPDHSLANMAAGLGFKMNLNSFFWEIGGSFLYFSYKELSNDKVQPFSSGNALFPYIYAYSDWLNIYMGYWQADDFIVPLGEAMYSSVSEFDESMLFPERKLFILKLDLHHRIAKNICLGGRFEGYNDMLGTGHRGKNMNEFNYSYSVYITFDSRYLLLKP